MSQCHRGGGSVTTCDKCDIYAEQPTANSQADAPMCGQVEAQAFGQAEAPMCGQAEPSAVLFDIAPKQSTAAWDDDCPF